MSFSKKLSVSVLMMSLVASVAQANMLKAGISTAADIFSYMKTGTISAGKSMSVTPFRFGATAEARMVYAYARGASGEFIVTVDRNPGKSMTQMFIEISQELGVAGKKAVAEMPPTYMMNGDVSDTVKAILNAKEANAIGQRAMQNLSKIDGLKISSDSIGTVAYKLEEMAMELPVITVGRGNSAISLANDVGGLGTSASFRIEVGLSKTTTPEEIQTVMDAVLSAIK